MENYYALMVQEKLHKNQRRLRLYAETIFNGVDFNGARVLDIGGGGGLYSFYAAVNGAKEVVCLEPESDGSTTGVKAKFERVRAELNLQDRVEFLPISFQNYYMNADKFDILLLHNSINHLNERACIHLPDGEEYRNTYLKMFQQLYELAQIEAKLIACDCSCNNFFAKLGVKNPFAPQIEWYKHQKPETWIALLQEVGFHEPRIRWTPYTRFYKMGQIFTQNKMASYFLNSHFCLTMSKA